VAVTWARKNPAIAILVAVIVLLLLVGLFQSFRLR
jgi:hypothetical protein